MPTGPQKRGRKAAFVPPPPSATESPHSTLMIPFSGFCRPHLHVRAYMYTSCICGHGYLHIHQGSRQKS